MATLTDIRTALASSLGAIRGLRVEASVPDNPKPPTAIVIPQGITFDMAMRRSLDEYEFSILLITGRMSERQAQNTLDAFCAPTGTSSIKAVINADATLGGVVQSARVTNMRNYGSLTVGDADYLSAEFAVTVYA